MISDALTSIKDVHNENGIIKRIVKHISSSDEKNKSGLCGCGQRKSTRDGRRDRVLFNERLHS